LTEVRDEQRRMRAEIAELGSIVSNELKAVASVLVDVRDLLRDRLDVSRRGP